MAEISESLQPNEREQPTPEQQHAQESVPRQQAWELPSDLEVQGLIQSRETIEQTVSAGPWDEEYGKALDAVQEGKYGTAILFINNLLNAEKPPSQAVKLQQRAREALTALTENPNPRMAERIPELQKLMDKVFPNAASHPSAEAPRSARAERIKSPAEQNQAAVPAAVAEQGSREQGPVADSERMTLYQGAGLSDQTRHIRNWMRQLGAERVSMQGFSGGGLVEDAGGWLKSDAHGYLARVPTREPGATHDLIPLPWQVYNDPQRMMLEQFFDAEDLRPPSGPREHYVELVRPTKMRGTEVLEKGLIRLVSRNTWKETYEGR